MKKILPIIIIFFCVSLGYTQNNIIRGIVKLQSSGSQPLAGVKMSAFGAGSIFTNDNGMFEMVFQGKKPGSPVSLFVQKDGYELINDRELENCVIRQDPDDLILVVMARQGERNRQALAYYNIIIEKTNNNYNKQLNDIHSRLDALDEDDNSRNVLRQQIEELQKEKEALLNRAEELAKQLASVDLDRASTLARDAYKEFNEGNIEAALLVLNDEALDQNFFEARAENSRLRERLMASDSALSQSIENYMIKARFCASYRRYEEAIRNYTKAYTADSTNVKNVAEIGDFCDNLNRQEDAIRYYNQALLNSSSESVKVNLLLKLGHQYSYNNNYPEAEKIYHQSYMIAESLALENQELYGHLLAEVSLALGRMYAEWNNDAQAEGYYLKALELYRTLSHIDSSQFNPGLANALRSMGDLYSKLMELDKADHSLQEALSIYSRLDKDDNYEVKEQIAATYLASAILMARSRQYEKAEGSFAQAISILKILSRENPFQYEPQLASAQMSSSVMYYHWGKLKESEGGYKKTIRTYERLASENPRRYEPSLAKTLLNMGSLYSTLENYDASEEAYGRSLLLRRRLAREDGQRFSPSLCHVLLNIAFMKKRKLYQHYDMTQVDPALGIIKEVDSILDSHDNNLPWVKQFRNDAEMFKGYFVGITLEDLKVQNEIDKTIPLENSIEEESDLDTIISLYHQIRDTLLMVKKTYPNNERLSNKLSLIYGNVSVYHLYKQQFSEAEISARKGLELNQEETWIYSYLALALAYQGKSKDAIKIYEEYMDHHYDGDSLKSYFIEDLNNLEAAGVIHKDNEKIKRVLGI